MELEWSPKLEGYTRESLEKVALTQASPVVPLAVSPADSAVRVDISGDDYSGSLWLRKADVNTIFDVDGSLDILNEGVFVAAEDSSDWLDEHFSFLSGFINFSARSINLPAGRDRVIKDERFRAKKAAVSAAAFRVIDRLVSHSREGGDVRRQAAVILAHIYDFAGEDVRQKILSYLDEFQVELYKSARLIGLRELWESRPQVVYLHYPKGRWVEDLTSFDGKKLYHKQDDLTDLQAALMLQDGLVVIAAARNESSEKADLLLEAAFVMGYLKRKQIPAVDLARTNIVEGRFRSKPVPQALRQRIGTVKFVEIAELPNKMSWLVGTEVWVNIAHPVVGRAYYRLQAHPKSEQVTDLLEVLVNVLSYDLENAFRNLSRLIESTQTSLPSDEAEGGGDARSLRPRQLRQRVKLCIAGA
jgi:hypothetical protein